MSAINKPKRYRMVKFGEVIRDGDEYHVGDGTWLPELKTDACCLLGKPRSLETTEYRRQIAKPSSVKRVKSKDGPWSYSPMRAMLRYKGKSFAMVTPDGKNALDPVDAAKLLIALNGGHSK